MKFADYSFEDSSHGRSLVVTGPWSSEAAAILTRGEADGLVLNYALGFSEQSLELLDPAWRLRSLNVLDRAITDLTPIGRLGESLEGLSVQANPRAELDLALTPRLRALAAEWAVIGPTLNELDELRDIVTWLFDERDLHAFRDHVALRRLTVKDARYLESLDGIGTLPDLELLKIQGAPRLSDIGDVSGLSASLRELELEECRALEAIDDVASLVSLTFLGASDCGDIESFAPLRTLRKLKVLYAWGTTRVADADLSPLAELPNLTEIRMRDRREYKPRVADLVSSLSGTSR
jgi:hypothetical protein